MKYLKLYESFVVESAGENEISQTLTFGLTDKVKQWFEHNLWIKKWEMDPEAKEDAESRVKQIGKMEYIQEEFKVNYQYFNKFQNGVSYASDKKAGIESNGSIYNSFPRLDRNSVAFKHISKIYNLHLNTNPNASLNSVKLERLMGFEDLKRLKESHSSVNSTTFIVGFGTIDLESEELKSAAYERCSYYALVTICKQTDNSIELFPNLLLIKEDKDPNNNQAVRVEDGPYCKIEFDEIEAGLKPGSMDHRGWFKIAQVEDLPIR
jgi:hypothetical protein